MRVTKQMLQDQVDRLNHDNRRLFSDNEMLRKMADYDHKLVERLLTIFERTAGEAQLRLSAAGALTATDLELAKKLPQKRTW